MSKKEKQKQGKKMSRKMTVILIIVGVLLFPFPIKYLDGGTIDWTSLTYTLTVHNGNYRDEDFDKKELIYGTEKGVTFSLFGKKLFSHTYKVAEDVVEMSEDYWEEQQEQQ